MPAASAGFTGAIVAPFRLLVREARQWLPIVAILAMIAALPDVLVRYYVPDLVSLSMRAAMEDPTLLLTGLYAALVLVSGQLVVELLALMFAFVILADLSAGRTPNIPAGLRRLASWKLQFVWIVAGIFEQTAISTWFLGGALLLVPFAFVTTSAYEDDNGWTAFGRSIDLGFLRVGPESWDRPGFRVALPVTLGFFVGFLVNALLGLASCLTSAATAVPSVLALLEGRMPESASLMPSYGIGSVVFDLALAPLAMLPTVYMITVQQTAYWQARRGAEG